MNLPGGRGSRRKNAKKYRKNIKNLKKQRQNSLTEILIHNKIKRYSEAAAPPFAVRPNEFQKEKTGKSKENIKANQGVRNMKTYMANAQTVERKWYVVDAAGLPLGRVASKVAAVLRGKNKPTYTPNVDCGDFVIVLNSDKIVLTGKKSEDKFYRYHTGYIGGLKEVSYKKLMAEKSDVALYEAIRGMLPKNSLGRAMIKKLKIYKGAEHNHAAQKPEELKLF